MRLLLLHFLILTSLFAQAQFGSNLKEMGLNGNVKSLSETEFQITDRYGKQRESRKYSCTFDLQGNKVEEKHADPSGATMYHTTYKYNADGRLTNTTTLDKDVLLVGKVTFSYDKRKITEQTATETKALYLTGEYEFDDAGRLLKHIDRNGEMIIQTSTYTYSANNCKTGEQIKTGSGEEMIFQYSCDGAGRALVKTQLDASGKEIFKTTYKYDSKGNVISESSAYSGESDPTVMTYQYVYDQYDNWTERKETMNGSFFSMTLRRFQYY